MHSQMNATSVSATPPQSAADPRQSLNPLLSSQTSIPTSISSTQRSGGGFGIRRASATTTSSTEATTVTANNAAAVLFSYIIVCSDIKLQKY
jgi:hypothetical protein